MIPLKWWHVIAWYLCPDVSSRLRCCLSMMRLEDCTQALRAKDEEIAKLRCVYVVVVPVCCSFVLDLVVFVCCLWFPRRNQLQRVRPVVESASGDLLAAYHRVAIRHRHAREEAARVSAAAEGIVGSLDRATIPPAVYEFVGDVLMGGSLDEDPDLEWVLSADPHGGGGWATQHDDDLV